MRKILSAFALLIVVLLTMPQAFADDVNATTNETDGDVSDSEMPDAPTGLDADAISGSEIRLSWILSGSTDVDGYNIYRSMTEEPDFSSAIDSVDEAGDSYDDTGLEQNTTYYYVVRAFDNSSNEENNTVVVYATTLVDGDGNETDDETDDADDDDEDDETENETAAMTDPYGAEMRLLQLERAIERNIERGNEVIGRAEELGLDTGELELIVAELEELKAEVQSADPEADDAVEVFVDLKKDAIELTQEFRTVANELFDESEISQLRNRIRQTEHKMAQLDQRINETQRLHFAENLKKTLSKLGYDDADELVDSVANGEMTMEEALIRIREYVASMNQSSKNNAYSSMKKENAKAAVKGRAQMDDIEYNYTARQEERVQERLEKLGEKYNRAANLTNDTGFQNAFEMYAGKRLNVTGNMTNASQGIMDRIMNRTRDIDPDQEWDRIMNRTRDMEPDMIQDRDRLMNMTNSTKVPPGQDKKVSDVSGVSGNGAPGSNRPTGAAIAQSPANGNSRGW